MPWVPWTHLPATAAACPADRAAVFALAAPGLIENHLRRRFAGLSLSRGSEERVISSRKASGSCLFVPSPRSLFPPGPGDGEREGITYLSQIQVWDGAPKHISAMTGNLACFQTGVRFAPLATMLTKFAAGV